MADRLGYEDKMLKFATRKQWELGKVNMNYKQYGKMKMRKELLQWGVCAVLSLTMAACFDDSKTSGLLDKIPADVDFVAVCDVKTMMESAGGSVEDSKLRLPSYLTRAIGRENESFDEFNSFLKHSGIDLSACAVAVISFNDPEPVVVFALEDENKFVKAIEKEGYREKDRSGGATFYSKKVYESSYNHEYDEYDYVAVKGECAYWVSYVSASSDFKPMRVMERMMDDAADKSCASMGYGKYIISGNAGGIAVRMPSEVRREMVQSGMPDELCDLYEGVVAMRGDISANEAKLSMKFFDENGKERKSDVLSKYIDCTAKVNPKVLAYMDKDEFFVGASSMKGVAWDSYFDMVEEMAGMSRSGRAQMTLIKSFFEKIDGTVAFGVGIANGMESVANMRDGRNVMAELAATLVCETRQGKAKAMVSDLKSLLDNLNLGYDDTPSGLVLPIPETDGSIYIEAKEDVLILSNRQIKANNNNPVLKCMKLDGAWGVVGLMLAKSNPLMRDLGIDSDVQASISFDTKSMETTLSVVVNGDNSVGIIGKLLKAGVSISQRADQIEEKFFYSRYGGSEWDDIYDYADTIAECDTMAVDWDFEDLY